MSVFEVIFSVSFLIALFTGLRRFDKIEKERETLAARCSDFEAKFKKAEEDQAHTLKSVRQYYDEKIERKEKEIEGLKSTLSRAQVAFELQRMVHNLDARKDVVPGTDAGA